jgi:transcription-repair coupling factor (superfamily II helicase)
VEHGGVLTCAGVSQAAQPFVAALLRQVFPKRTIVAVADNLKTQESFQLDLETWLSLESAVQSPQSKAGEVSHSILHSLSSPLFYPAWDVLPHEGKLPHADTISERLETLVALSLDATRNPQPAPLVITSVTALLQKTFPPEILRGHTRALARGDRINPLDLIEWLEAQGYEPEAQVTQKGDIALRGGILDVWPLTSPWPVRLEFFGDELESLRHFDPLTQISREEITTINIPPGGELGILKRMRDAECGMRNEDTQLSTLNPQPRLATLLDYLPRETIFLLCEPEQLAVRAGEYARDIPAGDPFFIGWTDFLAQLDRKAMTRIEASDAEVGVQALAGSPGKLKLELQRAESEFGAPRFVSLDTYRPLAERAPDPQIAEAQRREFFNQLHRWLRQDYAVHVFCNNDGERQRFLEIWAELGLGRGSKVESR